MIEVRKIIRAFLASPGDLQNERKAIRDVIKEFNETWSDELGYQVELIEWEETVAGFGRPQHLINQDLDRCDLFIGMIWKRWGTPPDAEGKFTSGFHEEFERSVKRREKSEKPEICLFFKEIDEEFMVDRGPELIKVLEFRDKIISEKSILFQKFSNIREIEKLITKSILHYVNRIRKEALPEEHANFEKQTKSQNIVEASNQNIDTSSPLSSEGFSFLKNLIVKILKPDAMDNLNACEIARFRLLANSITKTGNDEEQLGVHDINILFENRNRFVLGNTEIDSLIRFGFRNLHNENTPLWYWYSKQESSVYDVAVLYSFLSENDSEKAGAIRVLTLLGKKLPAKGHLTMETIINFWFSDKSPVQVRNAALDYFKINGELKDFGIVKSEYERNDNSTSRKALESMISILHRTGEEGKAENLILETQFDSLDPSILQDVLDGFSKLKLDQLQIGLKHQNSIVRLRSLSILTERDALNTEIVEKFTNDSDPTIRYEALGILIGHGKKYSDKEAREILVKPRKQYGIGLLGTVSGADKEGEVYFNRFVFDRLCELNEKELIELDNKASVYDDGYYFALAHKYFSKHANKLRVNIDDHFREYFDKMIERVKAIGNNRKIDDLVSKIKKLEDLYRKGLTRKGLDILCKKSKLEDINRIRENLRTSYAGASILDIEYFYKNGDWDDIELLANTSGKKIGETILTIESNGEFQDSVGKVAYKLGKNSISELFFIELPPKIIKKILETCSEAIFRNISKAALFRLLNNKESDVRRVASMIAVRAFRKKRLKTILDEYVSTDDYRYYNVIHWLDLGVSMSRQESKRIVITASK